MQRKFILILLTAALGAAAQNLPYQDTSLTPEERAADMVSRMTLDEKIQQVGHQTPAVSRLGLKGYNYWNEAIHGVARSGLATSFPVSKALSATWNTELMYEVATAISDECRVYSNTKNKGLIYWCPTINMSRDPRWGRDEENYGEDPYLTGRLAVEFIRGMQGDDPHHFKTIATAKHFAANNYEKGRHSTSSDVDDRSLREYYLPAFETAVREANVRSIMSAYNAVNGVPCGANHELLIDILRGEWGFDGFVTSDCGAVDDIFQKHHYVADGAHAAAVAMRNGEDLNCGTTFQEHCRSAIAQGLMTEEDLDRALTRVLAARFSVGEFDPDAQVSWTRIPESTLDCADHRALALEAAHQGIVLLKNDGMLPLTADKSVAIIGPLGNTAVLGGYSGSPSEISTLLEAVAEKMDYTIGDGTIQFEDCTEQNVPSGSKRLTHETNGSAGNLGYIYNNDWVAFPDVDFGAGCSRLEICHAAKNKNATTVHFYLDAIAGSPAASVVCPVTGNWSSYRTTSVEVDPDIFCGRHKLYAKFSGGTDGDKYCANMDWVRFYDPNRPNPLETDGPLYFFKGCEVSSRAATDYARAMEVAAKADVVLFAAGTDLSVSDESHDRTSLNLPGDQQQLLEAVYSVNPNVVLVLQTCSSVTIPWAEQHCRAIVEAWYAGQAQGEAIADVVYGDFNPCGKLTSTWYRDLADLPAGMMDYNIRTAGYTYMYHRKTPLYPFGFGLSYTEFEYSDFALDSDELAKDGTITASATITNIGERAGAEVVQLYARCVSELDRPALQLVGFARVELEPGESKTVAIPVRHDQLAYFNTATQTFDVEDGTAEIMLGASSADIRGRRSVHTEGATVKTTYRTGQAAVEAPIVGAEAAGSTVYDLTGRPVGTTDTIEALPAGVYLTSGRKILKR